MYSYARFQYDPFGEVLSYVDKKVPKEPTGEALRSCSRKNRHPPRPPPAAHRHSNGVHFTALKSTGLGDSKGERVPSGSSGPPLVDSLVTFLSTQESHPPEAPEPKYCERVKIYPSRTSVMSIRQKPRSKAYVAPRSAPWAWVSGIISSLMTYSIVPPAKARAKGRIAVDTDTAK